MVAPTGERLELLAVDVQPSNWDEPLAALRAGVPHSAWTVDDLDDAYARAVEAGGRSVWTPRDTSDPGLRIAFVADPDGNLVELSPATGERDACLLFSLTFLCELAVVVVGAAS